MRHDKQACIHEKLHAGPARLKNHLRRHIGVLVAATVASAALLILGQVASAETQAPNPESVAGAWVEALNRGDSEGAISLYSEDAVILFLDKEIKGKPAIAERQRTTITGTLKPSLKVEDLTVQGDTVKLSLLGENGITRFDRHDPVRAVTTLTIQNGKIVKEVGPVLGPADAAWYAQTAPRFLQSQAKPSRLPQTGEQAEDNASVWTLWTLGALGLGALFVSLGIALRRLRPSALQRLPREEE